MNRAQFKDHVPHICLASAMVAFWGITQEVAGATPFNDRYFFSEFSENI